jgi:apolipoprotein N-acyltransferase
MAQARAVEEGLPLVRSANTGISGVIDPYGRIWGSLGLEDTGVIDSPLPRAISPTPFSEYGNVIPLILAGLCLLLSVRFKKSA